MTAINDFITTARANNIDDDTIRQTLEAQGWDAQVIKFALLGMDIPAPVVATPASVPTISASQPQQPSLHPLLAALHHVLLWFFVVSSTVAIVSVVASLFGEYIEARALAAMIAVVAVTFTPYAILFILYLRKLRYQPNLVPGKVWSIITICLNSLSALGAAITLVVTAIVGGETSVMVGASLVFTLTALVAVAYVIAAFTQSTWRVRKPFLVAYLPIVALLLGTLFILSLVRIGPAIHDEDLRTSLATTVENIRAETQTLDRLPTPKEATSLLDDPDITYSAQSDTTYELCATFESASKSSKARRTGTEASPMSDSYSYSSDFRRPQGQQCFVVESSDLMKNAESQLNSYDSYYD